VLVLESAADESSSLSEWVGERGLPFATPARCDRAPMIGELCCMCWRGVGVYFACGLLNSPTSVGSGAV